MTTSTKWEFCVRQEQLHPAEMRQSCTKSCYVSRWVAEPPLSSHLSGCWGSAGPPDLQGKWCVWSEPQHSSRSGRGANVTDVREWKSQSSDSDSLLTGLLTAGSASPLSGQLWSAWCRRWRRWSLPTARLQKLPSWFRWGRQWGDHPQPELFQSEHPEADVNNHLLLNKEDNPWKMVASMVAFLIFSHLTFPSGCLMTSWTESSSSTSKLSGCSGTTSVF